MKFCRDQGQTHFLKPWHGQEFELEISAGCGDSIYLLARGNVADFHLEFEGHFLIPQPCQPCDLGSAEFRWLCVSLPIRSAARVGALRVLDSEAALAMDGATGLPVVRLADPASPEYVTPEYGDSGLPTNEILALLPPELRVLRNPDWSEAWLVAVWLHSAWEYRNTHQGKFYCPWRIGEILHWGGLGLGPDGTPPIAMCVHFAVAFLQSCLALGTPARLLPLMSSLNSGSGHFVAELWSRSLQKWVLIDPQACLCFLDDHGIPLNALEVNKLADPRDRARCGPDALSLEPVPANFPYPYAVSRELFRHIGVWRWADFYSRPDHAAEGHGTTAYAETAILWFDHGMHPPMFPYALREEDYLKDPTLPGMVVDA